MALLPDRERQNLLDKHMKNFGRLLYPSIGPASIATLQMMKYARHLRDIQLWQFPIIGGAVLVYQQLSAGREWQITGKIKPSLRAVEFLNNTKVVTTSGMTYTGLDEFEKRRSLDNVAVGRVAFAYKKNWKAIEYLDPTVLTPGIVQNGTTSSPVKPNEMAWQYHDGRNFRANEIFMYHAIPLGAGDLFIAPLAFIVPTAMLAWLVREHDLAAVDGRKIRDVLVVGSEQLAESIKDAIQTSVALWAGEDASKVGVPVVTINNMSGIPVENHFARLGLANIPESFNRREFVFDYVNQIAGTLGISLRHFWNEESTTNRALEEIQEQRQLQKGPSFFVRTEERQINRSGVLNQFGKVHFSFIEEVDTASQKVNAEVLKLTAEALEKIAAVFGASLSLEGMLAWMQAIRVLPSDLELLATGAGDGAVINENPDEQPIPQEEGESITPETGESPQQTAKKSGVLDYDEVAVDSNGRVVNRRQKIFSVVKHLKGLIEQEESLEEAVDSEQEFEQQVDIVEQQNISKFIDLRANDSKLFESWENDGISVYSPTEVQDTIDKILWGVPLEEVNQVILDLLLSEVESSEQ